MFWMEFLQALWFIFPAYCANAFPPVMKGRMPIDFYKCFGGKRFFGDHKTIEGTFGGILFGIAVGLVQMQVFNYIPKEFGIVNLTFPIIMLICIGALFGDIAGSFVKRRMGVKPGESFVLLDQLGFLIMALLFASLVYIPSIMMIVILLIVTPVIHAAANILGFVLKIKKQPW